MMICRTDLSRRDTGVSWTAMVTFYADEGTVDTPAVSTFFVRQDLYQNVIDTLAISTLNFDTGKF